MKTRIVQIGNSRRYPPAEGALEEAQLADEVELDAEPGIVIRRGTRPRAEWASVGYFHLVFTLPHGLNGLFQAVFDNLGRYSTAWLYPMTVFSKSKTEKSS
jgi:hypothetical protein